MQHTCEQKPNDEGRILPGCSACNNTAHGDGRSAGARHAAEDIFELLTKAVKDQFNPIAIARKDEAIAAWENGRTALKLIDQVRTRVQAMQAKAFREHIEDTTVPLPPSTTPEDTQALQDAPEFTQ